MTRMSRVGFFDAMLLRNYSILQIPQMCRSCHLIQIDGKTVKDTASLAGSIELDQYRIFGFRAAEADLQIGDDRIKCTVALDRCVTASILGVPPDKAIGHSA